MLWGNNVAAINICPGLYLFNQCGGDVPIVKQWSGTNALFVVKTIATKILSGSCQLKKSRVQGSGFRGSRFKKRYGRKKAQKTQKYNFTLNNFNWL